MSLSLSNGQRLVFLGDSQADAKKYTHYLSSFLILMNPSLLLHTQTEGVGGESMDDVIDSGDHSKERYNRRVRAYAPSYVFSMFGQNKNATDAAWKALYETMIDDYIVGISGATPVLLGPFPTASVSGDTKKQGYTAQLASIASAGGYDYADLWNTLLPLWTNSANWTLIGGADSVHPGTAGHIVLAYTIINELGWDTSVSSATIAANTLTVGSQTHCTISGVVANDFGGIDFTRLDDRLPWAIDEGGRTNAAALVPAVNTFLDYSVTVTGLIAGTYDVYCDGELIGEVTSAALASGWNMAALTTGPVFRQGQEVLGRIRDMHDVSRIAPDNGAVPNNTGTSTGCRRYRSVCDSVYNTGGYWSHPADMAAETSVASALSVIGTFDAAIHTAAQPVSRSYSLWRQDFTEATLAATTMNFATLLAG